MTTKINCKSCGTECDLNSAYASRQGGFHCPRCRGGSQIFSLILCLVILIFGLPMAILSNDGCRPPHNENSDGFYGIAVYDNEGKFSLNVCKTARIIPEGTEISHSWQEEVNESAVKVLSRCRRTELDFKRILKLPGAVADSTEKKLEVILFDKSHNEFYLLTQSTE